MARPRTIRELVWQQLAPAYVKQVRLRICQSNTPYRDDFSRATPEK